MTQSFEDELMRMVHRNRPGYKGFCASIDLLAMKRTKDVSPLEATARINDLQQMFGDSPLLFPGGQDYRVCFAGDSIFIFKELAPDEQVEKLWPIFCVHVFAVTTVIQDLEQGIANPGIRLIVSYGDLLQIYEPDNWGDPSVQSYRKNWFVLSGVSEALRKCWEAERQGSKGGFLRGHVWHEDPQRENTFNGTPLFQIDVAEYRQPQLYEEFYRRMVDRAEKQVQLKIEKNN